MSLEDRIAKALSGKTLVTKKMFGGTCYMINGNMALGTFRGGLMARVGKEGHVAAVKLRGARPMEMNGRVMAGYILVGAGDVADEPDLKTWVDLALAFNAGLPPKAVKTKKPK